MRTRLTILRYRSASSPCVWLFYPSVSFNHSLNGRWRCAALIPQNPVIQCACSYLCRRFYAEAYLWVYQTLPLGSILSIALPLYAVCLLTMLQMPAPSTSPVIINVLPVTGGTLMHHVISCTEAEKSRVSLAMLSADRRTKRAWQS